MLTQYCISEFEKYLSAAKYAKFERNDERVKSWGNRVYVVMHEWVLNIKHKLNCVHTFVIFCIDFELRKFVPMFCNISWRHLMYFRWVWDNRFWTPQITYFICNYTSTKTKKNIMCISWRAMNITRIVLARKCQKCRHSSRSYSKIFNLQTTSMTTLRTFIVLNNRFSPYSFVNDFVDNDGIYCLLNLLRVCLNRQQTPGTDRITGEDNMSLSNKDRHWITKRALVSVSYLYRQILYITFDFIKILSLLLFHKINHNHAVCRMIDINSLFAHILLINHYSIIRSFVQQTRIHIYS